MKTPHQRMAEAREKAIDKLQLIMQETTINSDMAFAEKRKKGADLGTHEYDEIFRKGAEKAFHAMVEFKTIHN